jgi:glyoxylase-like metal-dependent hydrolase (beta-lactamase superfamily II)
MPWTQLAENLYRWTDTCNVYALVHEGRALLFDCGAGECLDHLAEIGASGVDWVLFTHHHREQCQGHPRLSAAGARFAVPAAEAALLRGGAGFWDDLEQTTVWGTPHVRPPRQPLHADRELADLETFTWGPYEVGVYATPGNTRGAVTYRLHLGGQWYLFSGDLVLEGGKLHTFYDSEWDYGFGVGFQAEIVSLSLLHSLLPGVVCPAHGPVLSRPRQQIERLFHRLSRFLEKTFLRDWQWNEGIAGAIAFFSQPTGLPGVRKFNDNLYKLGPVASNCYLLIGQSGRGLFVDCGLLEEKWLDATLRRMREEGILRTVEALIPSHLHGDHYLQAEFLRRKWGTEVWCLEGGFSDRLEAPYRYNETCLLPYYRLGHTVTPVARRLTIGEEFDWDGIPVRMHHLPGQTTYTGGVEVTLEGRKILFTGDNLFWAPEGSSGHEAVIARNGSQIDLQYLEGAEIMARIAPDAILAGHASEIEHAARQTQAHLAWAQQVTREIRQFSWFEPYSLYLDPYWFQFDPYIQRLAPGAAGRVELILCNLYPEARKFRVRPALPEGWAAQPEEFRVTLQPGQTRRLRVEFRVPAEAPAGSHLISADLTAGDYRWGEFFDARVDVLPEGQKPPEGYDTVRGKG